MASRIQREQLAIQHVRDPRERMPIRGMSVSKGPNDPLHFEAREDVRVLIHIFFVVVIDEVVSEGLTENEPGDGEKKNADNNAGSARVRFDQSHLERFVNWPDRELYDSHRKGL